MAYQPTVNNTDTATIRNQVAIYYFRKGLEALKKKLRFRAVCEPDILPKRNGTTVQWYRPLMPVSNTTPSSEGTVGTALTISNDTISATVSQYSDFYNCSALYQDTALSDAVADMVESASYRAALSCDVLARTELHSTTTPELATEGATFGSADIRKSNAILGAADVNGGPNGSDSFVCIVHPYIKYDLKADNTAGGFIDLTKYANPQGMVNGEVGTVDGTRIVETTNVKTSGTAPDVLYYCPIVARGAIGTVDLAGNGPSNVTDPAKQSFNVNVIKGGPAGWDPEGNIGSFVSYRFVTVFKLLYSSNEAVYRFRVIKANASLV